MRRILVSGLLLGSACTSPQPLPEVTSDSEYLSIRDCAWAERGQDQSAVECEVTLEHDVELKFLWWTAYDIDGAEIRQGGSGGLPWVAGERRSLTFELGDLRNTSIAKIEVSPH